MVLVQVDPRFPDSEVVARAAALLRGGRLVAFPTETVYGLGANALDPAAVDRIYIAKGRPAYNPLIVHVANALDVKLVADEWPERAEALARAFWPGPLTMVLRKKPAVPDTVTAGLPTVAVRVPSHPVALALISRAGIPIAAPSANRSMMLSPTTAEHVARSLGESVDMILDGGPTTVGIESTVIDLSRDQPVLLRPGMISAGDLERIIGVVATSNRAADDAARPSPGMLDRHYSPRARLVLVESSEVESAVRRTESVAGTVVIFATAAGAIERRMPNDARAYAARLYDTLHSLDDAGCDVIVVERVPDGEEWAGIRDRLERASRNG